MKKHIFLLLLAMIILQKSDAQSFQEIFGIIKKEFNVMLQKNAARLTQQGMEYLGDQVEKIEIVSSKKRVENTSNDFIDNPNQSISTNQTEGFLKKQYPNFYYLYTEVLKDQRIKQINFVFREKSDWIALTCK